MDDDIDKELEELYESADDSNSKKSESKGKPSSKKELKTTIKGALPYSIGGGLLGALGGYLFTGGDRNEDSKSKARRRLKNALVMGLMGAGIGGSGKIVYDFITDSAPPAARDIDQLFAKFLKGTAGELSKSKVVKGTTSIAGTLLGQHLGGKIFNHLAKNNYSVLSNYINPDVKGDARAVSMAAMAEAGGNAQMAASNAKYFAQPANPVLVKSLGKTKYLIPKNIGARTVGGMAGAAAGWGSVPFLELVGRALVGENAEENMDKKH